MKPDHVAEYAARISRHLSEDPVPCDWKSLDLSYLGNNNVDAKQPEPGQLNEEVQFQLAVQNA